MSRFQILEAIEPPNCQRLEQPDCCPRAFYVIMNRCWAHEPEQRPRFSELLLQLSSARPERVQALADSTDNSCTAVDDSRDYLTYKSHDVITILDDK